jgi:hypothetical protein
MCPEGLRQRVSIGVDEWKPTPTEEAAVGVIPPAQEPWEHVNLKENPV